MRASVCVCLSVEERERESERVSVCVAKKRERKKRFLLRKCWFRKPVGSAPLRTTEIPFLFKAGNKNRLISQDEDDNRSSYITTSLFHLFWCEGQNIALKIKNFKSLWGFDSNLLDCSLMASHHTLRGRIFSTTALEA